MLVSADTLPFRPTRGVYIELLQMREPHSVRTDALFARYDRERMPALVDLPGVAGVLVFSSDSTTLDPAWAANPGSVTFDPLEGPDRGTFRVHVYFLDGDPVEVAKAMHDSAPLETDLADILFAGPLRTIVPWEWSWFD